MDQAWWGVRPMMIPGMPGTVMPEMFNPAARMEPSQTMEGTEKPIWGPE